MGRAFVSPDLSGGRTGGKDELGLIGKESRAHIP